MIVTVNQLYNRRGFFLFKFIYLLFIWCRRHMFSTCFVCSPYIILSNAHAMVWYECAILELVLSTNDIKDFFNLDSTFPSHRGIEIFGHTLTTYTDPVSSCW